MRDTMKKYTSFIAGLLVGATLFGGTAAYAAGLLAERSTHKIVLDGRPVEAEAYIIGGNNYFKLREIAAMVDFGVEWDGNAGAVLIDTSKGYSPETSAPSPELPDKPSGSRENFSQKANPAVFTEEYTREIYNAIRQSVIDRDAILSGKQTELASMATDEHTRQTVYDITSAIGICPGYYYEGIGSGRAVCDVRCPEVYAEAKAHTESFIRSLDGMSDREKVRQLSFYVCDRLTYAVKYPTPSKVLASDEVWEGCCMAYAHCFMFMCQRAGIPCIFVCSEDHEWNQVYVEGRWWHVDVTADDSGNNTSLRYLQAVLTDDSGISHNSDYIEIQPKITAFAKELLVPGSTK